MGLERVWEVLGKGKKGKGKGVERVCWEGKGNVREQKFCKK